MIHKPDVRANFRFTATPDRKLVDEIMTYACMGSVIPVIRKEDHVHAQDWKPRTLDWTTGWTGGIEWRHCASPDPSEWHPEDIEIFYSTGRCHHLALALHRLHAHRIGVLFETDPDWLDEGGKHLPHHVFGVDPEGFSVDVRGRRPVNAIIREFQGTVGLGRPGIAIFKSEIGFRRQVLDRGDNPLRPAAESDIAAASMVVTKRFPALFDEIRKVREDWLAEAERKRQESMVPSMR